MKQQHKHKHKPAAVTPAQVLDWIRRADLNDDQHHPLHNPYTGKRTLSDCLRYLRLIQHSYLSHQLEHIERLVATVRDETDRIVLAEDGVVTLILDTVLSFKAKLDEHLHWEESVLFAAVLNAAEPDAEVIQKANLDKLLHQLQCDHHEFVQTMQVLSGLTNEFKMNIPGLPHFASLLDRLSVLHRELRAHFDDEESICIGRGNLARSGAQINK